MLRQVSREVLEDFVVESRGYLPRILDQLAALRRGEGSTMPWREASRLFHSLRGSAGMLGLSSLADVAARAERALGRQPSQVAETTRELTNTLGRAVALIEACLDAVVVGLLDDRTVISYGVRLFSSLEGRDADDEAEEIERVMASTETEGAAIVPSPPAPASAPTDELPAEVIEIFRQEAEDNVAGIATGLEGLRRDADQPRVVREIRRLVHNLKGAAASIGKSEVSRLSHGMEDLLDQLAAGDEAAGEGDVALLSRASDQLDQLVVRGEEVAESGQQAMLSALAAASDRLGRIKISEMHTMPPAQEEIPEKAKTARPTEAWPARPSRRVPSPGRSAGKSSAARREVVRVPLSRLDDLVRLMSELVVERTVFDQQLRSLGETLKEVELGSGRLRRAAGKLGADFEAPTLLASRATAMEQGGDALTDHFDELEMDRYTEFHLLSRQLAEAASDIDSLRQELSQSFTDLQGHGRRLDRLGEDLQDKLMGARLVSASVLAPRLYRTVRVTAADCGKKVELEIRGAEVELDKAVLDRLIEPLTHLLRNAVDHGIEPPETRRTEGKPETGRIELDFRQQGNSVIVEVHDDGAGIDSEAVLRSAVEMGVVAAARAERLDEDELLSLMFTTGLSTAANVSEVSGRGVGLDAVASDVEELTGSLRVTTERGSGTRFTIRLPVSLAVTRALLVEVADQTYALPLASVLRTERVDAGAVADGADGIELRLDSGTIRAVSLRRSLGIDEDREPVAGNRLAALIVSAEDEEVALLADRFGIARDIVLKSLGGLLRKVSGISAATLVGDGRVSLVLDPTELARPGVALRPTSSPGLASAEQQEHRREVVIADDSVGVRRMLTSLMEGEGWDPLVARDGQEALELIQRAEELPDLLLLDLEMPRLDGYEVTALLRSDERTRLLPIVVVTSRSSEKHRRQAMDLGVDEYVVKPYQREALLAAIDRSLLAARRRGG